MFDATASCDREKFEKEVTTVDAILDRYSDREFMLILDFISATKAHSFMAVDVALNKQLQVRYKALYECMRDN